MKKYKLTKQDITTYNGFQWEIGKKEITTGKGELCSNGWFHYYHSPLLAILLNPIHANFNNPRLFEVEIGGFIKNDSDLKGGSSEMTIIREIEIPIISMVQKVAFGILITKKVYKEEEWNNWADAWLLNQDRTYSSAANAAAAADAANASYAAAYIAAYAAYAVADTADASYATAYIATYAGNAIGFNIDLISIAEEAMKII